MLTNYITSLIRHAVPIGVGLLVTWAATAAHIVIDPKSEAALAAAAVAVVSFIYAATARALEQKWPRLSVLLGTTTSPAYLSRSASAIIAASATTLTPSDPSQPAAGTPPATTSKGI